MCKQEFYDNPPIRHADHSQLLENYHECLYHAADFQVHSKRFELEGDFHKAECSLELSHYWKAKALQYEDKINKIVRG